MKKTLLVVVLLSTIIQFSNAQNFTYEFESNFGSSDWETIAATIVDNEGNAYVYGSFRGKEALRITGSDNQKKSVTSNGKRDVFLAKFDEDGKVIFLENYGDIHDESAYSLVEAGNYIYLTGSFENKMQLDGYQELTANGYTDAFFLKIDKSTGILAEQPLHISNSKTAQKMFLDSLSETEIVLAGTFKKDITVGSLQEVESQGKTDIFYAIYDDAQSPGVFRDRTIFGGLGEEQLYDFIIGTDDEMYFAGSFNTTFRVGETDVILQSEKTDAFIFKIDNTGDESANSWGGAYKDKIKRIAISETNKLFIAGEYEHSILIEGEPALEAKRKRDVFLLQLDANLNVTWKTQIGEETYNTISSITTAGANSFYVTGGFKGTLGQEVSTRNSKDAYIALYQLNNTEPTWEQSWVEKAGHNHEDNLHLKRYNDGKLFISGFFSNAFELGDVNIQGKNYKDLFVGKFTDCLPIPGPALEDITICDGETVTLDAGAGYSTYEWINSANEPIGTEQLLTVSEGGTYTVKVTNATGCGNGSTDITIAPSTTTDLLGDHSSCSAVELIAPSGYVSYSWDNGPFSDSADTYTVNQTGTVNLTVKDNTGNCLSDDIQVTINNSIVLNLEPSITICEGQSATLDAGAGYTTYEWTNSANETIGINQTIVVSTSDTYSVTVTDATGCGSASTEVTVNPIPYFDFPDATWILENDTLDPGLSVNYSYSWNEGESTAPTFVLVYGQYGRPAYVSLVVMDTVCDFSHTDQTLVRQGIAPTEVVASTNGLEKLDKNSITVYPNPSSGKFYVNVPEPDKISQVDVFNISGFKIKTYQKELSFPLEIDLEGMSNGVYLIKVSKTNIAEEFRVVIK